MSDIAAELSAANDAFVAAFLSGDVHAVSRRYTPDGQLLPPGSDVITGHDPATGKELWRWGTWNEGHREQWWRLVPSPVVGEGMTLVCAPKRAPVYAVKLGGEGTLAGISGSGKLRVRSPIRALAGDLGTGALLRVASGLAVIDELQFKIP